MIHPPFRAGSGTYSVSAELKKLHEPKVEVHQASFKPLTPNQPQGGNPKNLDLILDVPLEISVVLGRTKRILKMSST